MKNRRSPSRRALFQAGALAGAAQLFPARGSAASPGRGAGPEIYRRFGVEPFINCTSTYTINGGSRQLPEVIAAMEQAAHYHVNLDELTEKVGARVAELLGGESAMVSSGAAGAVTCGAAACVAGGDPEKMQKLPDTSGLKDECVVPKWSRSYYDHAVRAVGVRMVEVDTLENLERALSPRTALAHGQANLLRASNPFTLRQFTEACHRRGVPVLIDAAADLPLKPNPYLAAGVDLVAYSGGKILCGPQTSGILLGRKDLVRAAYQVSSPHITFGRSIKVSKEEIIGIAVAVESLFSTRDRDAEDREWITWFEHIAAKLARAPGVTTKLLMPEAKSYYPTLQVSWDPERIGLTAGELGKRLLDGRPRIMTHAEGPGHSFVLRPAAMYPGEYEVVAERLHQEFGRAPGAQPARQKQPPAASLSGRWQFDITFVAGATAFRLYLDHDGSAVNGVYSSPVVAEGTVTGSADGDRIELHTRGRHEGMAFHYIFTGRVERDALSGTVELGWEDGQASWRGRRLG
jgi:D-glucosaminate-6-phosphate ammonia-lyase